MSLQVTRSTPSPLRVRLHASHQPTHGTLSRISMSLPEALLTCIDRLVVRRGFPSRSHAIAVIVGKYLAEHKEVAADEISTGTITLLHGEQYDVPKELGRICARYPVEIKSRTSVAVSGGQALEVLLIHGPRGRLLSMEEELDRLRGVTFAKASIGAGGMQSAPAVKSGPADAAALSA